MPKVPEYLRAIPGVQEKWDELMKTQNSKIRDFIIDELTKYSKTQDFEFRKRYSSLELLFKDDKVGLNQAVNLMAKQLSKQRRELKTNLDERLAKVRRGEDPDDRPSRASNRTRSRSRSRSRSRNRDTKSHRRQGKNPKPQPSRSGFQLSKREKEIIKAIRADKK